MLWFFGGLIELIRDLAVIAAATGVAKWAWERHMDGPRRRDEEKIMAGEAQRLRQEMRELGERVEAHLSAQAAAGRERADLERRTGAAAVELAAGQVLVHRILQASKEPYLSFAEIESQCAREPQAGARLEGERLRRVLIELVADGVVSQLDHDRYFIASDFESDDEPA